MSEMKDGGPALKLEMSDAEGFNVVIAPTDEWEGDEDYFTLIGSGTRQDVIGLAIVRAVNERAHLLRCEEALREMVEFCAMKAMDRLCEADGKITGFEKTPAFSARIDLARSALSILDEARNGK